MDAAELIDGYALAMRRRGLAAATIAARRRRLHRFDRQAGLLTAGPEDIEVFLDGRDLGDRTRYHWVSDLHGFYGWALTWGHHDHDPTTKVVRPRVPPGLPRPIPTADLALALEMAGPTMKAWLSLAAFAGLRCKEIAELTVDGVLWDDGLLRVVGKGRKERLVPLHPEVERVLRMTPMPARGRVFRRPRGGGYPAAQVSREGNEYLRDLGIGATMHQLRHWFGTNVHRLSGGDLRVTQELLGHASPAVSAVYAAWSRQEARRAVVGLGVDRSEPSLLSDWPT